MKEKTHAQTKVYNKLLSRKSRRCHFTFLATHDIELRRCIGRCFSVSVIPWISAATETIPRRKAKYCQRDGIKEQNNEANHDNGKEDEWRRERGFDDKCLKIRNTPTEGSEEGHSNTNCPKHANNSASLHILIKYLIGSPMAN